MKKYPKLVYKNKAICKAITIVPTGVKSMVPAIYVKSLPMVIGALTVLAIFIVPVSRQTVVSISQNAFAHFNEKNQELVANLVFSLRTGFTAYSHQVKKNIEILPIDYRVEPQVYAGRTGKEPLNRAMIANDLHTMSANLSKGFSSLR